MPRRSLRILTTTSYAMNEDPSVNYKETVYRISTKNNGHHLSQPEERKTASKKISRRSSVLFILFLCFGLSFWSLLWNSNFLDAGPSLSPGSLFHKTMEQTECCRDMERQVKELQNELLRLKKQINRLLPAADILPNFALKSLGANVLFHLSSETHQKKARSITIFGIPIRSQSSPPGTVIEGNSPLLPGCCWPFSGGQGHLVISLSHQIAISHVTLGHISKDISPSGNITSAPKDFIVYAMKDLDDEGTRLGAFLYDLEGGTVQTFKIPDNKQGSFKYVRLQVESNWGNPEYTCLYSFRVHGKLADD